MPTAMVLTAGAVAGGNHVGLVPSAAGTVRLLAGAPAESLCRLLSWCYRPELPQGADVLEPVPLAAGSGQLTYFALMLTYMPTPLVLLQAGSKVYLMLHVRPL